MTVEVRYRPGGQYQVLISKRDNDQYSAVTCMSAAAVGTAIRRAADRGGLYDLRLPILVGGQRPRGEAAIPDDLKSVLVEIVRERTAPGGSGPSPA
jgi:hypothetical protein